MKTLIVYTTRHGCTEKCVEILRQSLPGAVDVVNLRKKITQDFSLGEYRVVLIGGSIHAGQVQKSVRAFCRDFSEGLKSTTLGLFLCCMERGEKAQDQFDQAFPQDLRGHAAACGLFGGEFDFEKMNLLERAIVKKVAGIESSVSQIAKEAIEQFARDVLENSHHPD
jgi:menaquinone-dependent protoporphyrinogen oxidase